MKAAPKAIVQRDEHEGHRNVLFLMRKDDSWYGTASYTHVADGRLTAESVPADNGHRMKVFIAADGSRFGVFADWSARRLS